jgi:type II secretory pathway pseudopilin PulG
MNVRALSVVELVVVLVVLVLLAALAVPQFGRAATRDPEEMLRAELARLRTAIELYVQDHGAYPGQTSTGLPGAEAATAAAFIRQLTQYTDDRGRVSATPSDTHPYGPYLRDGIPRCPGVTGGDAAGVLLIAGDEVPTYRESAVVGWVYNCETGYIAANSSGRDAHGMRYDAY